MPRSLEVSLLTHVLVEMIDFKNFRGRRCSVIDRVGHRIPWD